MVNELEYIFMKRKFFYFCLMLMAAIAYSCAEGTLYDDGGGAVEPAPAPAAPALTLTLNKSGEVVVEVIGTGSITIDWGDGKAKEIHTISNSTSFRNVYSGSVSRTITISGANITRLNCSANRITQLNIDEISTLAHLLCSNNDLENLDASKNTRLVTLLCNDNKLSSLSVSANTFLQTLYCDNNQLTELSVAQNTALQALKCSFNNMNASALDALLSTLHGNPITGGKTVIINNNPGVDSYRNKNVAESRGWEVVDN